MKLSTKFTPLALLVAGLMAGQSMAQQPAPATAPAAVAPQGAPPLVNPQGEAATPPPIDQFQGPDGKMHTFPLKVYDENANPREQMDKAIAQAKAQRKRVLGMWGENYCSFCLFLEDILTNNPNIAPIVKSDYVWVRIDLGKMFSKNREFAESYDIRLWEFLPPDFKKQLGAPVLSVIDPETGRTVGQFDPATGKHSGVLGGNSMVATPMTIARPFDDKIILEFLQGHRPPPQVASSVLGDAQAQAKKESKPVLALFTMPGSEACDAAAAWLDRADVGNVLANAFVVTRLDTERMTGGVPALKQAVGGKLVLPPVLVALNDKNEPVNGKPLFTTLPKTTEQIDEFLTALASAGKLGESDKALLRKSLTEASAAKPKAEETKTEQ